MLWLNVPNDQTMDKKAKFELMEKVARELVDLKNSQEAVIKKVSQIEAHNFELNDSKLEELLSDIHESVAENLLKVAEVTEDFQQQTSQFATENSAALAAEE